MGLTASENGSARSRGFGSFAGWLLVAFLTMGGLFMYSGAMAHGAQPVHPIAGTIGWILAGLAPLPAGISYQLLLRGWPFRTRHLRPSLIAIVIYLLWGLVAWLLLMHGLGEHPIHLG